MGTPDKKEKPILARNIVRLRKSLGYRSAEEFAEAAEISYPTLRNIEAGISQGNSKSRAAIAKALGVPVDSLFVDQTSEVAKLEAQMTSVLEGLRRPAELDGIPLNDSEVALLRAFRKTEAAFQRTIARQVESEALRQKLQPAKSSKS